MKPEVIFISFSKPLAYKIANIIYHALKSIYTDSNQTKVFLSNENIIAGPFQEQIHKSLKEAKNSISILTEENKDSSWLMYEAGALAQSATNNGGVFIPYLFCRHRKEMENPLQPLQCYEYQRNQSDSNKEQFIKLITDINAHLSEANRISNIKLRGLVAEIWNESISEDFSKIAKELLDFSPSARDKTLANQSNIPFYPGSYITTQQNSTLFPDDFSAKTPKDIQYQFERILELDIPKEWRFKNSLDESYNATRVIVNGTRISTFVAFTDGTNILLFDRPQSEKMTNVENQRIDVFGSVQFENRSIQIKIDSEEFLNAPIEKISPLNGAAFEVNRAYSTDILETAVMFGIVVYMKPENLMLAKTSKNPALIIIPISKAKRIEKNKLTSKAHLAISQL